MVRKKGVLLWASPWCEDERGVMKITCPSPWWIKTYVSRFNAPVNAVQELKEWLVISVQFVFTLFCVQVLAVTSSLAAIFLPASSIWIAKLPNDTESRWKWMSEDRDTEVSELAFPLHLTMCPVPSRHQPPQSKRCGNVDLSPLGSSLGGGWLCPAAALGQQLGSSWAVMWASPLSPHLSVFLCGCAAFLA